MGASYGKQKDAKKGKIVGRFTALPHNVIHSVQYRKLSHASRSLLFDIAAQYNGKNNGGLVACNKYLKPLGWSSNDTVSRALKQLEHGGFLVKTKQGMRPPMAQPSLYALGWLGLDITDGLDVTVRSYQRSVFTPINSPWLIKNRKMITPTDGVESPQIIPMAGIDKAVTAPIAGAVNAQNPQISIPVAGEYIYKPYAPAQSAGDPTQVIH